MQLAVLQHRNWAGYIVDFAADWLVKPQLVIRTLNWAIASVVIAHGVHHILFTTKLQQIQLQDMQWPQYIHPQSPDALSCPMASQPGENIPPDLFSAPLSGTQLSNISLNCCVNAPSRRIESQMTQEHSS